ncbi:surface carbohydrate biosynthesis protein [Candidatus Electrothrix sp.]|uniref:surface carbohydrate biosynthesis protein n=1 Tax=Candidatus Electrothrix sp. TaxID=2170559 RepID=UPI004055BACD
MRADMDLIVPIETKVREFHAKAYLATVAAERGFKVCIGDARSIRRRLGWLPVGAYFLDKSVVPNRTDLFRYYRALGLRVVAWCEEGFSLVDKDAYLRHRINPDALSQTESFFTWGPYQSSIIKNRYPELAGRIADTGNPRIDILHLPARSVFNEQAKLLRQQYPHMILINTNFSMCNHKKGRMGYIELLKSGGKISTTEDEEFAKGWMKHKENLFIAFKKLVFTLSQEFGDRKIIIRPHPSENHDVYRDLYKDVINVDVIHEGNVIPWLMAADIVIHNGCTTAVEACLLDRPVLAYRPFVSDRFDIDFPNQVSVDVSTEEDVVSCIHSNSQIERAERDVTLQRYIHKVKDSHADAIVDLLYQKWESGTEFSMPLRLLMEMRRLAFRLRMWRACSYDSESIYEKQKFGKLERKELLEVVNHFSSNRKPKHSYDVHQIWKNCFVVKKATEYES